MNGFYEYLLPGGVLAMPFMTLWEQGDPLENEDTSEVTCPEDGATIRRWSYSRFDPTTNFEHTIDHYEIMRDGHAVASEEHQRSPATRSYTQEQALALYQEAGLQDIQAFQEFTFEPVKPDDRLFSVLGFKPK
jgi:hypothetical protein